MYVGAFHGQAVTLDYGCLVRQDCHKKLDKYVYQTSCPSKFLNFYLAKASLSHLYLNFRWQVASDLLSPARIILVNLLL